MGKACTCCEQKICNCRRIMDSLDFSFGDFNTSFEINKDIFDVNCYMYFYVGDATGYYKQDGTRVPYKKYLIEISLDSDEKTFTSNFKLDKDFFDLRLNATTKFYIKNNKYYIEFPDERFVRNISGVYLKYKKKSFTLTRNSNTWNSINPWNIVNFQEQLRNSGIEEFQNCIVNFFSANLPADEPSLNIKWVTDMRCPFHYSAIKYYEKRDCSYNSTCQGVSRGVVKSSYRLQKTITPDLDYNDSLGIFTRTYHGFLLEIRYVNGFFVASYPNYIDQTVLNPDRTRLINMIEENQSVTKGCLPYATNCPIPPGRDPVCGGGTIPVIPPAGSLGTCDSYSGFGEIDINDGPLSCPTINCDFCYVHTGSYDCYCNCGGGSCCGGIRTCCCSPPGKEKTLSCFSSSRRIANIDHQYFVNNSIEDLCSSINNCCCSDSVIYNDTIHHLCVGNSVGFGSFSVGGVVTQPIAKICKNEFKVNATTILNLKNKDINCYIDEPSKLLRSIFRLTDNQTTPPIDGCDFTGRNLIGSYRIKIFQGAASRFRSTLFKTEEQFRNTLNYQEAPFLSCYKSPTINEYCKSDPVINNSIPMYIDPNTGNLKFFIIPDRLSTKFNISSPEEFSSISNGVCQSLIEKCTYWAYIFNCDSLIESGLFQSIKCSNNSLDPIGIKLIKFHFNLIPVYNPGPPIDSYFIMTCRAKDIEIPAGIDPGEDSGGILSEPVIVRSPQDLYQDLTFNVAPNITWTINLLGTWRG